MAIVPVQIRKKGGDEIIITWSDERENRYSAVVLRQHCRCAACRHELTGELLWSPEKVSPDLKVLKAELVGRYAIRFEFSDGHTTGIYSFEHLRSLAA